MNDERGKILLVIAREAIENALTSSTESADRYDDLEWLQKKAACFVTLTQHNRLRGCIGSLEPHRRLIDDVRLNAVSAAIKDDRFSPMTADELSITEVEVSLLSPPQPMEFFSEQDALNQLLPDVDGLIFEAESRRSTFLPQVWESLHEPKEFLSHLKLKAGVAQDYWSDQVKLYRYTVMKWKESEFGLTAERRDEAETEISS